LPFVPGSEVAGIITEVGPEVDRFKLGDRVVAVADWGGLSEETVVDDATVYPLPDAIPFHLAVSLTPSYATSLAALTWSHLLNVQAGETLLVHGSAGGVGLAAVEIGKILGATVIATAGTDEKCQFISDRGADYVINYREQSFREPVLDLTHGRGAHAIYDPVGGEVFMQSLRCIAPEGRICPIGFAGGTIPQIPANILLVKNVTVCALNLGYYLGWSPHDVRYKYVDRLSRDAATLCQWYNAGRISLATSHTFPLEQFQEAMQVVVQRRSLGRVVLRCTEDA
jgi:NADPH2:quinone reductase